MSVMFECFIDFSISVCAGWRLGHLGSVLDAGARVRWVHGGDCGTGADRRGGSPAVGAVWRQ